MTGEPAAAPQRQQPAPRRDHDHEREGVQPQRANDSVARVVDHAGQRQQVGQGSGRQHDQQRAQHLRAEQQAAYCEDVRDGDRCASP